MHQELVLLTHKEGKHFSFFEAEQRKPFTKQTPRTMFFSHYDQLMGYYSPHCVKSKILFRVHMKHHTVERSTHGLWLKNNN